MQLHIYSLKGVDNMAAVTTKSSTSIVLRYKTGVDTGGNDIVKNQKIAKVKVTASDDNILAVGNAIGALLEYTLTGVSKIDESQIVNG